MSICELTGTKTMSGNNVSHSERKTRRKFKVNIQKKTFFSASLKSNFSFKIASRAIKTLDKFGGLDNYLLKTSSDLLSEGAKKLQNRIKQKIAA
jgi:large subunit ribosomal protein L28